MKILVIASWYPDDRTSLRGSFFRRQAVMLNRRGHQIAVVVAERPSARLRTPLTVLRNLLRAPVYVVRDESGFPEYVPARVNWLPAKFFGNLGVNLLLRDMRLILGGVFRDFGTPDIVHVHSAIHGAYLWVKAGRQGIPFVITEHRSNYLSGHMTGFNHAESAMAFARAGRIITVSRNLSDVLGKLYSIAAERFALVPNVVDPLFFQTAPSPRSRGDNSFRFISVGNIVPVKRHDLLLHAFRRVRDSEPRCRLVIVGAGPGFPDLQGLSARLGLCGEVDLKGALAPDDVAIELSKSDAFVFSSDHETFGLALAEACAVGLPVVATKCGGPEGVVNERNGLLVPKGDPVALAEAMLRIIHDRKKYRADEIRQDCLERFGQDAVIGKLEQVYEDVLGRRAP